MKIDDKDLKKFPQALDLEFEDEEMNIKVDFEKDSKEYMKGVMKEIEQQ